MTMLKNNNIAIIIAQFNKANVDALVASLNILEIPDEYTVDLVIITDVVNKADAYREAALANKAKYRIYLDEKIRIIHKNFLQEIINVFKDDTIGAIGVLGAETVPTDGKIRNTLRRVGEMQFASIRFYNWNNEEKEIIKDVLTVEEYLLATQYETSWMDRDFESDEYLFSTQCIELAKNNYRSVVSLKLGQSIVYNADSKTDYNEHDRLLFLERYYQDVFPLVDILIPTYNRPKLLKIALDSALAQTYKNIEIIITDNNEDNTETFSVLKPYMDNDKRIKYFHQKGKGFKINDQFNWLKNYDNPKAEYVSWLMDDDVYYPEKIATMIDYYLQYDGISLVTSARDLIDIDGRVYEDCNINKAICDEVTRFSGDEIGRQLLTSMLNFIGEPTTVLLKKSYLDKGTIGWNCIEGKYVIIDFPRWLDLMTKGDLVYIPQKLSALRLHDVRDSNDKDTQINLSLCWLIDIKYAWDNNYFLHTEKDYELALLSFLRDASRRLAELNEGNYFSRGTDLLKRVMVNVSLALVNGYNLDLSILWKDDD